MGATDGAHIAQPAALLAIRPSLREVGDTDSVVCSVNLHVGGLFAGAIGLVDGDVLDAAVGDETVSGTGADKIMEFIVDFDVADDAFGLGEVGAVEAETDAEEGAVADFGLGLGHGFLAELDDAEDAAD